MKRDWTVADRLSDEIIEITNRKIEEMEATGTLDPFQLLAGQLFGLVALLRTLPTTSRPLPLAIENLRLSVEVCLKALMSLPSQFQ